MLSWGKGFFRAWIVLSIMWGVATVLIAKPQTYALLWNAPKYEIEFGSGRKVTLDTSRSHEDLAATLDGALQREPATSIKKAVTDDRNEILDHFGMRYSTAGDRATNAWLITIIPPAVLLAIGLALAWILRGFRRATA
jgi:hypothetical protein